MHPSWARELPFECSLLCVYSFRMLFTLCMYKVSIPYEVQIVAPGWGTLQTFELLHWGEIYFTLRQLSCPHHHHEDYTYRYIRTKEPLYKI
jgi:hypothetical protein